MNHIRLHEAFPLLPGLRARAVIDTDALTHNYHALLAPVKEVSPNTYAIAVVKADAYGHGIRPVVSALLSEGCRSFAVACLEEAVALRRLLRELMTGSASDLLTDILVLGHTDPRNAPILAAYHITATLLSAEYASRLLACAREARVTVKGHIALDTDIQKFGFTLASDGQRQTEHHFRVGVESHGVPRGNSRANDNLFKGSLQIKVRNVLQIAHLFEFYPDRLRIFL